MQCVLKNSPKVPNLSGSYLCEETLSMGSKMVQVCRSSEMKQDKKCFGIYRHTQYILFWFAHQTDWFRGGGKQTVGSLCSLVFQIQVKLHSLHSYFLAILFLPLLSITSHFKQSNDSEISSAYSPLVMMHLAWQLFMSVKSLGQALINWPCVKGRPSFQHLSIAAFDALRVEAVSVELFVSEHAWTLKKWKHF